MAKLLFHLRGVPDDEADSVRHLLEEQTIEFSETNAGILGIGTAAIWVVKPDEFDHAKNLVKAYQKQRYDQARSEYEHDKKTGKTPTLADAMRNNPIRLIGFLVASALLIYLVLLPFFIL